MSGASAVAQTEGPSAKSNGSEAADARGTSTVLLDSILDLVSLGFSAAEPGLSLVR